MTGSDPKPLDSLRVTAPCDADWGGMARRRRGRFCDACGLTVHDTRKMTRKQVASVVSGSSGRLCLRLEHLPDGSLVTRDSPRAPGRLAAFLSALLGVVSFACGGDEVETPMPSDTESETSARTAVVEKPLDARTIEQLRSLGYVEGGATLGSVTSDSADPDG